MDLEDFKKKLIDTTDKCYVPDITNKIKDDVILIICESPGTDEVMSKKPLVGDAGKSAYYGMYGKENLSIGEYVASDENKKYGIMNICNFPLQSKDCGELKKPFDEETYKVLELIRIRYDSFGKHREEEINNLEKAILENFTTKLKDTLNKVKIKKIIACGDFVQKYIEKCEDINFNGIDIIKMPHPSYNSWRILRDYCDNFIKIL